MKPGLKHVLPRGATTRRKLSSAATSLASGSPPPPYYYDTPGTTSTSPGSSSHGAGPSSPRLVKHSVHPGSPTTAITPYSAPATHSGQSTSLIAHPRYTTNSSHAYPGSGLPLVWLVPPVSGGMNDMERRLPWEGTSEGKGKDRNGYRLEMGAYGIPKRRRHKDDPVNHAGKAGQPSTSSAASTSTGDALGGSLPTTAVPMLEDPSWYNLAVQVGEDAYFLRPDALGVADGVGGWKHKGESNSALFAKKLMHFCSWELAQLQPKSPYPSPPTSGPGTPSLPYGMTSKTHSPAPAPPPPNLDPIKILQSSYDRCISEAKESGLLGSSTATLAILAENELRIAHVGDCVACVVRDGEIIFRSEEMQHSFNYPYQLGPRSSTTPETHAQRITIPVQAGDIVILASDGMGDNLWDEDVLDEINRFIRHNPLPPPSTSPASGGLTFSSSSSSGSVPSTSPLRQAHPTGGPVTNTVLAQRLSEALASRAKRVSERRAMTADASGTMGAFAARKGLRAARTASNSSRIPPMPTSAPPPPPVPYPPPPSTPAQAQTQQPTPPPTPKLQPKDKNKAHPEGMEMPRHNTSVNMVQSDGQFDDVLGDGFGGDGEYGGSGYGYGRGMGVGWGEEEEEEEWVRDEIPFGRRAKEAGVRFVGGKGDDISVLVAIISGVNPEVPIINSALGTSKPLGPTTLEGLAKLNLGGKPF